MRKAVERAMNDDEIAYIVLDYPFGRDHSSFSEIIDLSVFIDTPLDIAMARRILRDSIPESGLTAAETLSRLRKDLEHYVAKSRLPYLDTYRHKGTSDLILNGYGSLEEWRDLVLERVRAS
jgi:uridine kinase